MTERHDDIVTLHDHFSSLLIAMREVLIARIDALREYADARFKALETATDLSKEAIGHRLDSMNKFRDALNDQSSTFVTKAEHNAWCNRVTSLESDRDKQTGKADQKSVATALIVALSGTAIGICSLIVSIVK